MHKIHLMTNYRAISDFLALHILLQTSQDSRVIKIKLPATKLEQLAVLHIKWQTGNGPCMHIKQNTWKLTREKLSTLHKSHLKPCHQQLCNHLHCSQEALQVQSLLSSLDLDSELLTAQHNHLLNSHKETVCSLHFFLSAKTKSIYTNTLTLFSLYILDQHIFLLLASAVSLQN